LVALMVALELNCGFAYAERFVRRDKSGLVPVEYRLPVAQRAVVEGKRVAIVNDVTSAGSAVRGTYEDLKRLNANVVVIGSFLVLGNAIHDFTGEHNLRVEALALSPAPMIKACIEGSVTETRPTMAARTTTRAAQQPAAA
jgi:adenine/guanine phosphoribosyltransferase-like PRPP-binding protein